MTQLLEVCNYLFEIYNLFILDYLFNVFDILTSYRTTKLVLK